MTQAQRHAEPLTLTVNRRLSRSLALADANRRLADGQSVWHAPDVLPLTAWLERAYAEIQVRSPCSLPSPLGAYQERVLWEAAVRETGSDAQPRAVLQNAPAARLALQADALLARYRVTDERWRALDTPEVRAFARWRDDVHGELAARDRLPAARLADSVERGIKARCLRLPARVTLAGFDVITPELEALIVALRAEGVRVEQAAIGPPAKRRHRLAFTSARDELVTAARWARGAVEAPGVRSIGVLVADLAERRQQVWDTFEDLLHPNWYHSQGDALRSFDLSLGEPLSRLAMTRAALAVLAAGSGRLDASEVTTITLSQNLRGSAEEIAPRARLEAWFRDRGEPALSTRRLAQLARNQRVTEVRGGAKLLATAIDTLARGARRGRRLRPSQWAGEFTRWLSTLGWPGEGAHSGTGFRAAEAIRGALETLAGLDTVIGSVPVGTARRHLERILDETIYQPAPEHPAPVQIMGALEAAGLELDGLWVCGMHDRAWPPSVDPHPLLPLTLQSEYAMPGASRAVELERARRIAARWLSAASEVWVSHTSEDRDGPLRPSALFSELEEAAYNDPIGASAMTPADDLAARPARLIRIDDLAMHPLSSGMKVRGGSAALKDQAACPFRAAARHRLLAKDVARAETPLDARARGRIVHRLLECLWRDLQGVAAVKAMDGPARSEPILRCVERALDDAQRERPYTLRGGLRRLEARRLTALATDWLALESERSEFTVTALEQRQEIEAGGLRFEVIMDRIDRLGDGRSLLMDYKTGSANPTQWLDTRPDEPQLPLYAQGFLFPGSGQSGLAGVAFARVRSGDLGFAGIGENTGIAAGMIAPGERAARAWARMDELIAHWRDRVDALASELRSGDARVMPKRGDTTCRYCNLATLCRVSDHRLAAADGND